MNTPVHTGAAAIPFRAVHEAAVGQVMGSLGVAVLILAVMASALFYARRRGWLQRWIPSVARASSATRDPHFQVNSQRLSRHTVLHIVKVQGQYLAITESSAHVALQAISTGSGEGSDHGS